MNINALTIEQKVGQMLMFAFHGTEYNDQLNTFINELNLGGVICFARNIESVDQVSKLNRTIQSKSKVPMFISLDQEGGPVKRVISGITSLPGAMSLASTDRSKIYEITKAVGSDLKNLGFNINCAPVGDINNNPLNPVINSRSYSDDPKIVAKCSEAAFKGFQDGGILPTMKHFPGHGNTNVDSHIGLPVIELEKEEVEKTELVPFINAIDKGIDGIMMSHILFKAYDDKFPSSLSKKIINDLLIEQLGFKGLIVTDSLTMGAIYTRFSIEEIVYNGINAGNDILVFCGRADINEQRQIYNTFLELVKGGKISIERVNRSVEKILKLKEKYVEKDINLADINLPINNILSKSLHEEAITLVKDNNLLPLKKEEKVLLIFPEIKLYSLVDNANQKYETLNKYINVEEIIINQDLNNLDEIIKTMPNYDKIILATYNINKDDYQTKVFNILDKDKVIVISMRSPYDILHLNGVRSYVCAYELTKESLEALARCLYGELEFKGKLPIIIEGE